MIRFLLSLVLLVLVVGCDQRTTARKVEKKTAIDESLEKVISNIVDSEATILELSPWVSRIGESLTENGTVTKERLCEAIDSSCDEDWDHP